MPNRWGNAGAMLAPFGAARAGFLPAQVAKVFGAGPQNTALAAGQQAAIGAGAGLGGGVASEVAPDNLKPLANIAGQLVGGGLTAGGMAQKLRDMIDRWDAEAEEADGPDAA